MERIDENQVSGTPVYASWERIIAFLIDMLILAVPIALLIIAAYGIEGLTKLAEEADSESTMSTEDIVFSLSMGLLQMAYFVGFETSRMMGTPGKKAIGLIVTDSNGQRLTVWRSVLRYIGKFLNNFILYAGYLLILFTPRRQGVHDMLAGTVVVKEDNFKQTEYES